LRVSEAIVDLLVPVILARCPILWILFWLPQQP
jgi:hypothetical protein